MIVCTILENGNLRLSVAEDDRAEFAENLESRGFWSVFCDGMESYSCNGSFTPFDAGDSNPFVGLTCAPCIAEEMAIHDDGTQDIVGRFWWFPYYAIRCPLQELADTGETVFQFASQESE